MSYQRERDEFIARMSREGLDMGTIRGLLRAATTLQRLAVAQCNGDWPADNGERPVFACSRCEGLWVKSTLKGAPKLCQDCRTADRVTALLPQGWRALFGGDPRGAVLRVLPDHATNEDRDAVYVPPSVR